MQKLFISILFIFCCNVTSAQDIHFSQFNRSYLNLNPALTGQFDGDYRLNANLRNQWNSVSEPYQTFSFAADAKNISQAQGLNAGLAIYNDQAGAGDLTTTQISTVISFTFPINSDSTFKITAGIQPSYNLKSIDYTNFKYDNQYNGLSYDPSRGSGENFAKDAFSYLNIHSGIYFEYEIERRKKFHFGTGLFNLLSPQQSFYSKDVRLDKRLTFHTGSEYYIAEDIDILPSVLFSRQGEFQELVFGTDFRYYLSRGYPHQNLYAGLWYRNNDALFLTLGFDYGDLHAGISYDINTSDLEEATNKKGGFEFSVTYIIKQFNPPTGKYRRCPKFL